VVFDPFTLPRHGSGNRSATNHAKGSLPALLPKAPFTIGVSNPFISSEYRTQMIEELIATNQEYMDQGLTTELVIESADTDVAGQIQQLQNLIAQDVDAILVNPGDVSGLNATLQEALDAGIISPSIRNWTSGVYIGIDQKNGQTSAQWLQTRRRR
jgi:ribose transport system substrate-binding protein